MLETESKFSLVPEFMKIPWKADILVVLWSVTLLYSHVNISLNENLDCIHVKLSLGQGKIQAKLLYNISLWDGLFQKLWWMSERVRKINILKV